LYYLVHHLGFFTILYSYGSWYGCVVSVERPVTTLVNTQYLSRTKKQS